MRFGITTSTSEEITKGLRDEGIDVPVMNVKKENVKDISGYDNKMCPERVVTVQRYLKPYNRRN